ncbi:TRAPP II complex [Phyllosticta citribraziliensis]|uniref:TRAPP II complex n=1 Tax=Phyllosticta citribraziliensis TaxID=989973 RepID=A0ABR1LFX0_9PEZI
MAVDPFSPIAPARIRVLVVPAGKIKRSRFTSFVERLQPEHAIRLGDISPDPRPDRTTFSPLRNPHGMLLYHFTASMPPPSYLALSPFELYREPLMILGIADGQEYQTLEKEGSSGAVVDSTNVALKREELNEAVDVLREQYSRALVHSLLLFDSVLPSLPSWCPEETILVPPLSESKKTTMKTVMCDLSSLLLAEMTTLAKSLQALPEITISSANVPQQPPKSPFSLVRRQSSFGIGTPDSPGSRSVSPAQLNRDSVNRASPVPLRLTLPNETQRPSPPEGLSPAEEPSGGRSGETTPTMESISRPRALQRFSIQGFGSGSMEERARLSNACRHDMVDAQVCLMAGHVLEALKRSHEVHLRAESINDHLVMAKTLEQMVICSLVLIGQGQEFEIPTSCTPSTKGVAVAGNISSIIEWTPDLTSRVTSFYKLSFKADSAQLLALIDSENKIRTAKLLTTIERIGKTEVPTSEDFMSLLEGSEDSSSLRPLKGSSEKVVHISNILSEAIEEVNQSNAVTDAERATVYSEAAGCLARLGLSRKRAFVVTLLMDILVPALLQARKLGAAELGIHPAAGMLSGGIVPPGDKKHGETVFIFLEQFIRDYGVPPRRRIDPHIKRQDEFRTYGSLVLKAEVLRRCIKVCEAMGDLKGVVDFSSAFLYITAPQEPLEENDPGFRCILPRDDQQRLRENIRRTLGFAKTMGEDLSELEAIFWYDHLVHSVKYDHERAERDLHLRKNLDGDDPNQRGSARFEHQAFGNQSKGAVIVPLVAGEPAEFIITLRNPFAFSLTVNSIKLVSDRGVEIYCLPNLKYDVPGSAVQPLRVPVVADISDIHNLTRVRIKLEDCREHDFEVSVSGVAPEELEKMKQTGHDAVKYPKSDESSRPGTASTVKLQPSGEPLMPSVSVVPRQPTLLMKTDLVQNTLALLEGETKKFEATLAHSEKDPSCLAHVLQFHSRNDIADALKGLRRASNVPSKIYELGLDIAQAEWKSQDFRPSAELVPNGIMAFSVDVYGVQGLTKGTISVEYAATNPPPEIERFYITSRASQDISVTVQPSITTSNFSILPGKAASEIIGAKYPSADLDSHFVLLFDYTNASDRELSVDAWYSDGASAENQALELTARSDFLEPGQTSSMAVLLPRIFLDYANEAIPAAQDRQFVLTDVQQISREDKMCFWYRQKLLECLHCNWRDRAGRAGQVNCQALSLTPQDVGAVMGILDIQFSIPGSERLALPAGDEYHLVLDAHGRHLQATFSAVPLYCVGRGKRVQLSVTLKNTSATNYEFQLFPEVNVWHDDGVDPLEMIKSEIRKELLHWAKLITLEPHAVQQLEADIVLPLGVMPGMKVELGVDITEGPFPGHHANPLCAIQVMV